MKDNNKNTKPNILMIVCDQQRYDCLGYSDEYPVETPNIDKLAEEGVWFEEAYTPIPLCCPARQSLLHGRRAESFGALWNYDCALQVNSLTPEQYTWTQDLKDESYDMTYIGKWHVSPDYDPVDFGYDKYISIGDYHQFKNKNYPEVEYNNGWFGEADPIPLEDSQPHWLSHQCIETMKKYEKQDQKQPWHIRLDFQGPHLPCRPAGKFAEMYDPDEVPEWGNFRDEFNQKPYIQRQQLLNWNIEDMSWEDWAPTVALYYGFISQIDDAIGRVMDTVDQLGIAEDTIVIYTADHGDMCGAHKMMDKHYIMYDDVVKVPLIISWPGKYQPQEIKKFVSNFLDLPPTLLEIIGKEPKDFFHGNSLVPFLEGQKVNDWRQEIISTYNGQQFGLYNQRMLRNIKWKYIWNPTDVDELYNLENDPYELNNLIDKDQYLEMVGEFKEKLYYRLKKDDDGLVKSLWMKDQLLNNKKLTK